MVDICSCCKTHYLKWDIVDAFKRSYVGKIFLITYDKHKYFSGLRTSDINMGGKHKFQITNESKVFKASTFFN